MVNFLIDLVLVFWMLLFGGMALLPILTGDRRKREPEDIVLHITPARMPVHHGESHARH